MFKHSEQLTLLSKNEGSGRTNYRIVSLFSGIGGFERGIENSKLDGSVVLASEIDKFAQKSYVANYPNHHLVGDITKIDAKYIPEHDILMGGFPCQAFSIAGNRNGFLDTRGTLFFDVARIAKEKKPKIILLENVKNLVSHDKSRTIRIILKTLNDLGYTVDFSIINSIEAGVPQNRDRTYIIGIMNAPFEKFQQDKRSKKIYSLKMKLNKTNFKGFNFFNSLSFISKNTNIADILEKNVDMKYFLINKRVSNLIKNIDIHPSQEKRNKIVKLFDIPKDVHNDHERQRRVYSINGVSPTILARSDSTKILIKHGGKNAIRKFTPTENLKAQGFDNYFIKNVTATGVSDTQLYKQSGNAVSPPIITGIADHLIDYLNKIEGDKNE